MNGRSVKTSQVTNETFMAGPLSGGRYRSQARPETAEADHRERPVDRPEDRVRARGEEEVVHAGSPAARASATTRAAGRTAMWSSCWRPGHGGLDPLGPVVAVRGVDRDGAALASGPTARSSRHGRRTSSRTCSTKSARRTASKGPPGTRARSRASACSKADVRDSARGLLRAGRRDGGRRGVDPDDRGDVGREEERRVAARRPDLEDARRPRRPDEPEERRVALGVLAPVPQEPVRPVHPLVVVRPVDLRVRGELAGRRPSRAGVYARGNGARAAAGPASTIDRWRVSR